jgi:DivIVA domain-containing protein
MDPEDIERRDFFVGLRGYDRDEVNQFLAEVAAEHRAALDELERRNGPDGEAPAGSGDPYEDLGANVTAILRTANESAKATTAEAEAGAAELRHQADEYAERVRREVDEEIARARGATEEHAERLRQEAAEDALRIRGDAEDELQRRRVELETEAERLHLAAQEAGAEGERILEESRQRAEDVVERAHQEAGRILNDADGRAAAVEAEAEERGRERARATVEEAVSRLAEATRRHEDLRARLAETSDEIQLALMALGDPVVDPRQAIDEAVREVIVLDDAESVGQDG